MAVQVLYKLVQVGAAVLPLSAHAVIIQEG